MKTRLFSRSVALVLTLSLAWSGIAYAFDPSNTATGRNALYSNAGGSSNTANGREALYASTGSLNTAVGANALRENTTGGYNTAVGYLAGQTTNAANANTTGSNDTYVGFAAGPATPTQLSNATAIGANAQVAASNALVLGGTGPNAVSVGIGTTALQSTLQVVGNYIQLPTIQGVAPPAADCSATAHAGRMIVRRDGPV